MYWLSGLKVRYALGIFISLALAPWVFASEGTSPVPLPSIYTCAARLVSVERSEAESLDLTFITLPKLMMEAAGIPFPEVQTEVPHTPFFYTPVAAPQKLRPDLNFFDTHLLSVQRGDKNYPLALVMREPQIEGRYCLNLIPTVVSGTSHSVLARNLNEMERVFFQSQIEERRGLQLLNSADQDPLEIAELFTTYPLAKTVIRQLPLLPTVFSFRNTYVRELLDMVLPRLVKGQRTLVMGSGAGVDAFLIAKMTNSPVHAVDINPYAIANTRATALYTQTEDLVQAWQSDLFSNVVLKYDVIVFDAPLAYTPEIYTRYGLPAEEYLKNEARLASDPNISDPQAKVLKGFLQGLRSHLNTGGKAYLMTHPDISEFLPPGIKATAIRTFEDFKMYYAIQELTVIE